ncbi:MAG: hypothetical protein WC421_02670 [Elusimicrobiales bacterium]
MKRLALTLCFACFCGVARCQDENVPGDAAAALTGQGASMDTLVQQLQGININGANVGAYITTVSAMVKAGMDANPEVAAELKTVGNQIVAQLVASGAVPQATIDTLKQFFAALGGKNTDTAAAEVASPAAAESGAAGRKAGIDGGVGTLSAKKR